MKQTAILKYPLAHNLLIVFFLLGCTPSGLTALPAPPIETVSKEGKTIVSLTFDDGNADNFIVGAMLKEHGISATFYIASGLTGQAGFMSWDQLHILEQAGNEIGGHTLDHTRLENLNNSVMIHEVCDDRQKLIDHGFTITSFAYPNGYYNKQAEKTVEDCAYESARTITGGLNAIPPSNPYALATFPYIVSDTTVSKLKRYVSTTRKEGGGWLILVFHHVCDNCDFFSVKPDVLKQFIEWLDEQQKIGHINIMTIGDVMRQTAK